MAGIGNRGFGGDGGPATLAKLSNPSGLAVDGKANLYVADTGNNRVRRVTPDGTISTIAGTGKRGFAGDGGPATEAQLASPVGLALDREGNLYIADNENARIRRIDPAGVITTIAGTGTPGLLGEGGQAKQAEIATPWGLAFDSAGDLYFTEGYFFARTGSHRVRRISRDGIITTVAGSERGFGGDGGQATSAKLNVPSGLAFDRTGTVYIADHANSVVRAVDKSGVIRTFAGTGFPSSGDGGPAVDAGVTEPADVAIGSDGTVYILEEAASTPGAVRRVDLAGVIHAFPLTSGLDAPGAMTIASGYLYIADTGNNVVRRVAVP